MGLTICINRNNYADNTQISNRNRLLSASHYLPIKRMNMKIELENSEKALTLKDFEEVESKLGHAVP